jgi:hypothetical protein
VIEETYTSVTTSLQPFMIWVSVAIHVFVFWLVHIIATHWSTEPRSCDRDRDRDRDRDCDRDRDRDLGCHGGHGCIHGLKHCVYGAKYAFIPCLCACIHAYTVIKNVK